MKSYGYRSKNQIYQLEWQTLSENVKRIQDILQHSKNFDAAILETKYVEIFSNQIVNVDFLHHIYATLTSNPAVSSFRIVSIFGKWNN